MKKKIRITYKQIETMKIKEKNDRIFNKEAAVWPVRCSQCKYAFGMRSESETWHGRVKESNDMLNVGANKHNKITKDNSAFSMGLGKYW